MGIGARGLVFTAGGPGGGRWGGARASGGRVGRDQVDGLHTVMCLRTVMYLHTVSGSRRTIMCLRTVKLL